MYRKSNVSNGKKLFVVRNFVIEYVFDNIDCVLLKSFFNNDKKPLRSKDTRITN